MNTQITKELSDSLLAACKAAGIENPKYIAQDKDGEVWCYEHKPITQSYADMWYRGGVPNSQLEHPPYADDWQDSLLEFRDYALIRKCNKCQAVTAIDLIGNDENEKELQYDGETVFRVSKEEAHGAVIKLCKCERKPQGEPLADVLARHPDHVNDTRKVMDACDIAYNERLHYDTVFSSNENIYRQGWSDALAWWDGSDQPSGDTTEINKPYQPEMWAIRKDIIHAARDAIQWGIESSEELLARHDTELGRKHRKNKLLAESMEEEIAKMKRVLEKLQ